MRVFITALLVAMLSLALVSCHKENTTEPGGGPGTLKLNGVIPNWTMGDTMSVTAYIPHSSDPRLIGRVPIAQAPITSQGFFSIVIPQPADSFLSTAANFFVPSSQENAVRHVEAYSFMLRSPSGGWWGLLVPQSLSFCDSSAGVGEYIYNLVYVEKPTALFDTRTVTIPELATGTPFLWTSSAAIYMGWTMTDTTTSQRAFSYEAGWNLIVHRIVERRPRSTTFAVSIEKPSQTMVWYFQSWNNLGQVPYPWNH